MDVCMMNNLAEEELSPETMESQLFACDVMSSLKNSDAGYKWTSDGWQKFEEN